MNGKRLSLAAVICLTMLTLWGIAGCSKNNSSSTATDGTMTATVNGATYSAKSYVIAGYLSSYGQILIQGDSIRGNDTTQIQIALPYIPPVNTVISTDSLQYAGVAGLTYLSPGKTYEGYYGFGGSHAIITLSTADTVNHRIAGTFSGVLYSLLVNGNVDSNDSVVITNGTFNSTYQVQ